MRFHKTNLSNPNGMHIFRPGDDKTSAYANLLNNLNRDLVIGQKVNLIEGTPDFYKFVPVLQENEIFVKLVMVSRKNSTGRTEC